MHVEDEDKPALKKWVTPKLESVSDADAGVLADFVIALVSAEGSEEEVKQACTESLVDFLGDNTAPVIDEVLSAVKNKEYLPEDRRPKPSVPKGPRAKTKSTALPTTLLPLPALSAEAPPFNPPTGPSSATNRKRQRTPGVGAGEGVIGEPQRFAKKRMFNEREGSGEVQDPYNKRSATSDRFSKQAARRGGKNSRGGLIGTNGVAMPWSGPAGLPIWPGMGLPTPPAPPPGFPAFDPIDPMGPFLAFAAAAMGMGVSGMPPMPPPGLSSTPLMSRTPLKGRCKDYDTKGYCVMGSMCPFEHGGEVTMPQNGDVPEYDPNQASLAVDPNAARYSVSRRRGWKEGGVKKDNNNEGRKRTPFSHPGPSHNRSNTTIIVGQIPEENFSEEAVRDFFSEFGKIVDVQMQSYKRLAIVKYDDHFAATRAHDSPNAIFNNRFVKVYWMKPDAIPVQPSNSLHISKNEHLTDEGPGGPEDPALDDNVDMLIEDLGAIKQRQEEYQKAFEERQQKAQEVAQKLSEVEEQLKVKDEETRKLKAQIAEKTGETVDSLLNGPGLATQLINLQEEAENLGSASELGSIPSTGRGRGGYRGRGYYAAQGRGYTPFRGASRGRGGFVGSPFGIARSGVKRLDNRPRRIAISVEAGTPKDEALRQHLLNSFEIESIDTHPKRPDTQIISFKERYIAEMFLDDANNIPDVGKVELSWVPNGAFSSAPPPAQNGIEKASAPKSEESVDAGGGDGDGDGQKTVSAKGTEEKERQNGEEKAKESEYNDADDEDRWMAA